MQELVLVGRTKAELGERSFEGHPVGSRLASLMSPQAFTAFSPSRLGGPPLMYTEGVQDSRELYAPPALTCLVLHSHSASLGPTTLSGTQYSIPHPIPILNLHTPFHPGNTCFCLPHSRSSTNKGFYLGHRTQKPCSAGRDAKTRL